MSVEQKMVELLDLAKRKAWAQVSIDIKTLEEIIDRLSPKPQQMQQNAVDYSDAYNPLARWPNGRP